jgi:uncharacterized membrane protein SirB2
MPDYAALKAVHVTAVTLSGALFLLRAGWRFARPAAPFARAARIVPALVDTVLLASALALVSFWVRDRLPLGWIGVKVLVLAAYVAVGTLALRPGLAPGRRLLHVASAALAFGFIVTVALSKSPAGALRWLLPAS